MVWRTFKGCFLVSNRDQNPFSIDSKTPPYLGLFTVIFAPKTYRDKYYITEQNSRERLRSWIVKFGNLTTITAFLTFELSLSLLTICMVLGFLKIVSICQKIYFDVKENLENKDNIY